MRPSESIRLVDAESEFATDQRFHTIEEKVIELRSRLASDFNHVFKSGGGNEGDPCAFSLQQGIGSDGGSVQQRERARGAGISHRLANFSESLGNGARWVVRRGKHFQSPEFAALHPYAVGERASGVDGDAKVGLR